MMKVARRTKSLCPDCLQEIPAIIQVSNEDVRMFKSCPDHGQFESLVEKDPIFYMLGLQLDRGNIYDGLFVDVTDRCNTTCKYCYHAKGDTEPAAEDIIQHCRDNAALAPFIMIGGEPTLRDDLPETMREIRKIGPVLMVTNGLKLADKEYIRTLDSLMWPEVFNVSISLHPECSNAPGDYALELQAIENIIDMGMNLYGLIFVIDSLDQIDEAITINRKYRGRIWDTRLKIATELNMTSQGSDLFNSDIYNYLYEKAQAEGVLFDINHDAYSKAAYFNMVYDGINLTAVKWYSRHNVDLNDINCGPWHKNKDGRILNMDHSLILGG